MKCPWCGKGIEVKSRTMVKKVIKPTSSKTKQSASPSKESGKDRIEVVAPPAKGKAKSKVKSEKKQGPTIKNKGYKKQK